MQSLRAATSVRGTVALTLLASLLIGGQTAAHAHIELIGSSPEPGATVSASTDRVVLEFGADLTEVGNDVVIRDEDGHDVASGPTHVSGNTLQTPTDIVSSGRHTIVYRFVGLDGHAASGHLSFTVAADSAPHSAATALLPLAGPPNVDLDARLPAKASSASGPAAAETTMWLLPVLCLIGGLLLVGRRSASGRRPQRVRDDSPGPWQPRGS